MLKLREPTRTIILGGAPRYHMDVPNATLRAMEEYVHREPKSGLNRETESIFVSYAT